MRKIAVEETLGNVRHLLQRQGYQVIDLHGADLQGVDAVVLSGQDDNLMGIETIRTKAPVFAVEGMTAAEVAMRLERELHIER